MSACPECSRPGARKFGECKESPESEYWIWLYAEHLTIPDSNVAPVLQAYRLLVDYYGGES